VVLHNDNAGHRRLLISTTNKGYSTDPLTCSSRRLHHHPAIEVPPRGIAVVGTESFAG